MLQMGRKMQLDTFLEVRSDMLNQCRYLGSISSQDVSKDQHLSKGVKCSIYESIVLATLLYGCETWAVTQAQRHNKDVFRMSCLRRICHFSLRERRTNDSILALCKIDLVSSTTLISYRGLK